MHILRVTVHPYNCFSMCLFLRGYFVTLSNRRDIAAERILLDWTNCKVATVHTARELQVSLYFPSLYAKLGVYGVFRYHAPTTQQEKGPLVNTKPISPQSYIPSISTFTLENFTNYNWPTNAISPPT